MEAADFEDGREDILRCRRCAYKRPIVVLPSKCRHMLLGRQDLDDASKFCVLQRGKRGHN